jgi:hypothetical protein
MPTRSELRKLARARLKDALALFDSRRYHGALYLCGYAIEYALKARICTTLRWTEFPTTAKDNYRSFITHDLDFLLKLSGREQKIRVPAHLPYWSVVTTWKPEMRYEPLGKVTRAQASDMIRATEYLLEIL